MADERSAGFVVFRKQAGKRLYLLLMHGDGHWDFPKGNIERGETSKDAAIRELKEETGLKWSRQVQGWDNRIYYNYKGDGGRMINKEVIFYLSESPEEKITISEEHKGSGWFDFEQAKAKLKFDNSRQTLEKAEHFLYMNPGK